MELAPIENHRNLYNQVRMPYTSAPHGTKLARRPAAWDDHRTRIRSVHRDMNRSRLEFLYSNDLATYSNAFLQANFVLVDSGSLRDR